MNRKKWLRIVELKGSPEIACLVVFSPAVQKDYRDSLNKIKERYPKLFWDYVGAIGGNLSAEAIRYQAGKQWEDRWGCVWRNAYDGIEGSVVEHPLENWEKLEYLKIPDPSNEDDLGDLNWEDIANKIKKKKEERRLTSGGVCHGFLFNRLAYLRGFENLMVDIALKEKRLNGLINIIIEFNKRLIKKYLDLGVDVVYFGDDLGMQNRLMISPSDFRLYLKPP